MAMANRTAAGLVAAAVAGAAAWLLASPVPAPEAVPAEEAIAFEMRPLTEAVAAVSARAGMPVTVRPASLGERPVTLRLSAEVDGEALLRRFGEALDRLDLALVREPEPARGWAVIAFTRVAAAAPGGGNEPFVVRVAEGRVRLESAGRSTDWAGGVVGGVGADGRLLAARRIEPGAVARWRRGGAPVLAESPAGEKPTAAMAWRVIGTTEDGRSVVEWGTPGESPQRMILEKGAREIRVPLPERP
jgi:hypothetical protein